jgi:uncharacterized SAM-binding protein YcdF (DUF218 family)
MRKKAEAANLSAAFLKEIGDYMLVETPLAKADVCILFGNHHAAHSAEQAAALYKKGYFDTIVVSGGVTVKGDGRIEAQLMRDVLLAKGVPSSAILVEDKATNTAENAIYSRALLEKEKGAGAVKSVIAIGHIQASRRFLMTLERYWPETIKMFTTTNCFKSSRNLWYTDQAFKEAVLREYKKIAPYKALGFIKEIDLEKVNHEIATLQKPRPGPDYKHGLAA